MKILKGAGLALGGLIALVLMAASVLYFVGGKKVSRTYHVETAALAIPTDSASLARGAHVAAINGCHDCHGEDLSGQVFVDAPPFRAVASNLTSGKGGVGARYSEADWDRAIRHGVLPSGRAVIVMPSAGFHQLSDDDTAALIAYLQSIGPVDRELPPTEIRVPGWVLAAFALDPAAEVRTAAARASAPAPGPTAEYGAYLASVTCTHCHGATLQGTARPPTPGSPPAPNLEAAGQWTLAQFEETLRTGVTPGGHVLDPAFMPWTFTARMTDEELEALHAYLHTLAGQPPVQVATDA